VIDSPGIREFGLGLIEPEHLAAGFREFKPQLGHCRFRDCTHSKEPGCAILEAIENNIISTERMESYKNILASLQE